MQPLQTAQNFRNNDINIVLPRQDLCLRRSTVKKAINEHFNYWVNLTFFAFSAKIGDFWMLIKTVPTWRHPLN